MGDHGPVGQEGPRSLFMSCCPCFPTPGAQDPGLAVTHTPAIRSIIRAHGFCLLIPLKSLPSVLPAYGCPYVSPRSLSSAAASLLVLSPVIPIQA